MSGIPEGGFLRQTSGTVASSPLAAAAGNVSFFQLRTWRDTAAMGQNRKSRPPPRALAHRGARYRDNLDKQKYGNEGVSRQQRRCALPQMSRPYIDQCSREFARVLKPSGYLMLWEDAFNFCQGKHLAVADVLPCVDAIAWDKGYYGQGARARRQGSYLAILQKPPIKARATWKDHKIPDRWTERIIRPKSQHPHLKPIGLIARLIGAVTVPGDLVVDPAAGSFVVMRVANEMGRRFVGCDIACQPAQSAFAPFEDIPTAEAAE